VNNIMGIFLMIIFFFVYIYGAVKLVIFAFSFGELIGIISIPIVLIIMVSIKILFEKYFD